MIFHTNMGANSISALKKNTQKVVCSYTHTLSKARQFSTLKHHHDHHYHTTTTSHNPYTTWRSINNNYYHNHHTVTQKLNDHTTTTIHNLHTKLSSYANYSYYNHHNSINNYYHNNNHHTVTQKHNNHTPTTIQNLHTTSRNTNNHHYHNHTPTTSQNLHTTPRGRHHHKHHTPTTIHNPYTLSRTINNHHYHKHTVTQTRSIHTAVNRREKLLLPTTKCALVTPQRNMSWFDSMVVTQTQWFKSLSQCRLVEHLMDGLEVFHDYSGLPWWSSIILSTVILRSALTFPLGLYQKYIMCKIDNLRPEMNELMQELKKETAIAVKRLGWTEQYARGMYNRSARRIWRELIIRDNCHPFKASAVLLIQIPLWISVSVSLRNLSTMMPKQDSHAQLLYLQLSAGGFGWVPNLTDVDHSLILPVLMGLVNLTITEIHALNSSQRSKLQRVATNVFRVLSVLMIPIAAGVPSCISLYWATSSVCGLVQNVVLMHPGVYRVLGLNPGPSTQPHPYRHLWAQFGRKYLRRKEDNNIKD